jgi:quercetin dioxygenase-like cupin family protein
MAIPHAQPGEVMTVLPSDAVETRTLFKTSQVEVIRLVLPQGKSIAEHKAAGEIIVQCLQGRVVFHTLGQSIELHEGQMFYLSTAEPHSVSAPVNCSFLLTILLTGSEPRKSESKSGNV